MGKVKVRGSDATLGLKTGEKRCQRALSPGEAFSTLQFFLGVLNYHSGRLRSVASLQKPEKGKGGWIGVAVTFVRACWSPML